MTSVSLLHLTKKYPNQHKAVDNLSLEIPAGKLTAILGPSGCGKTTILKLIAGILTPTSGDILYSGISKLGVPAERRGAVMVFQNHLLFPFLSVGENIAFGLKLRGEKRANIKRKVAQMLELVQLEGYERRRPAELSGGQQQRVALARALVVEPRVLLLDEPLSNLDAHLRDEMRELIRSLQQQKGITTIFVTHDQEEAVILADQLALILNGKLFQVGNPQAFYENPANVEAALFFGAKNLFSGIVHDGFVQTSVGALRVERHNNLSGSVDLVIRPENIRIWTEHQPIENTVTGRVQSCVFTGTRTLLRVKIKETIFDVSIEVSLAPVYQKGEEITLSLPPERLWVFPSG